LFLWDSGGDSVTVIGAVRISNCLEASNPVTMILFEGIAWGSIAGGGIHEFVIY